MQDAPYRTILAKAPQGAVHVKVSPEDYEWLAAYPWRQINGYAMRDKTKVGAAVYMHRMILGLEHGDGLEVDHINRDRLDNRRGNLRAVTHAVNGRNLPSQSGSSKYRGVYWLQDRSRWKAGAKFDYRYRHLGYFFDEDEAARAVNAFWVGKGYDAPNDLAA